MRTKRELQMRRGFGFVIIIWVSLSLWQSPFTLVQASQRYYDPVSLDKFIREYANKSLDRPRTGVLYRVPLPANFSGIEISMVRLRSSTFWVRGSNLSPYFSIPPRIVTMPYAKRLALVYENLRNWSSHYYNVPGHNLITPVLGFVVFDASNASGLGHQKLNLSLSGNPISVTFPRHTNPEPGKDLSVKCVTFGPDGSVKFSNMTGPNRCAARGQGHFALVIRAPAPAPVPAPQPGEKEARFWKWWIVGFIGGFVVLVLASLLVFGACKMVMRKRMREMEKQSEKGVSLDTLWIGRSKMPSASMIRTQPVLETSEHVT